MALMSMVLVPCRMVKMSHLLHLAVQAQMLPASLRRRLQPYLRPNPKSAWLLLRLTPRPKRFLYCGSPALCPRLPPARALRSYPLNLLLSKKKHAALLSYSPSTTYGSHKRAFRYNLWWLDEFIQQAYTLMILGSVAIILAFFFLSTSDDKLFIFAIRHIQLVWKE